MNKNILNEIEVIMRNSISNSSKRKKLNLLEKKYPQELFIKTHLCPKCNSMNIEVWVKIKEYKE